MDVSRFTPRIADDELFVMGFRVLLISQLRNINRGGIRCPCRRCKNIKKIHPDVITMHILHKAWVHGELHMVVRT